MLESLDFERRRKNLLAMAGALGVLSVVAILITATLRPGQWVWTLASFPAAAAAAAFLARRRHVVAGALVLCLVPLVNATVGIVHRGQLGQGLVIVPPLMVMIASLTLPTRRLFLVIAAAWITISICLLAVPHAGEVLVPYGIVVSSSLIVNLIMSLLALLASWSTARALTEARQREVRAWAAEALAREAESRYGLITDNMSNLVALVDAAGKHLFVSPSYTRLLGLKPPEILGRSRTDLFHPDDKAALAALWATVQQAGSGRATLRARHADGHWLWFEMRMTAFEHDGGRLVAVSSTDVTERRALEAQVQQSQKLEALGQLASGVAHDFNNLLTVINGGVETAREIIPADSEARQDLDAALDAGFRAAALTRQLLEFSRKGQSFATVPIDLGDKLQRLEALIIRLVGREVKLTLTTEPGCWVQIAPPQVEQVVLNLSVNARDAMPAGGALTIALRQRTVPALLQTASGPLPPGRYVELAVADTGMGMTEDVRGHAFEPFFTTKAEGLGTGLGLATCRNIVRRSGGFIDVQSAPGRGTTFTVLLPLAVQPALRVEA